MNPLLLPSARALAGASARALWATWRGVLRLLSVGFLTISRDNVEPRRAGRGDILSRLRDRVEIGELPAVDRDLGLHVDQRFVNLQ